MRNTLIKFFMNYALNVVQLYHVGVRPVNRNPVVFLSCLKGMRREKMVWKAWQ